MNSLNVDTIHEKFKNMRPFVRFPHKKEWDNILITKADGYHIPSYWSNSDLDTLLTQLHSSIMKGQVNQFECEIIVAGACYLRKPGGLPDDRLIDSTNFGSEPLELNPSRGVNTFRLPFVSATDRAFGLFVCGFLFKILSKPSQNVLQSWSRLKERYMSLLSCRETPKEWPTPQLRWLESLKNHYNFDKRATRTALRLINTLEIIYTDAEKVESGLIQYLFTAPLSYTGMHAYKLFCDVKEKTGKETSWLLSVLRCREFCDALKIIGEINQNWELGGHNANPAFRYARLLGPQYFPEIQTKNCRSLVYCLARILSRYDMPGSNSNPENIVELENISEKVKAQMDRAASLICVSRYPL